MAFVARVFPYGFRRVPNGMATPRARFESIAVGSYLALQEHPELGAKHIDVTPWHLGEDFREVTGSDGANVASKLRRRLHFVRDKLLSI